MAIYEKEETIDKSDLTLRPRELQNILNMLAHLRSEIFLFIAWARTTVRGMHSSVSSVA